MSTPLIRERLSSLLLPLLLQHSTTSGSASKCISHLAKPEILTYLTSRLKCFKLMGLHPLCAAMFAAGFALREYGAYHYLYTTHNLIMYIVSLILIYVNP